LGVVKLAREDLVGAVRNGAGMDGFFLLTCVLARKVLPSLCDKAICLRHGRGIEQLCHSK
jgi:hypothetical protein